MISSATHTIARRGITKRGIHRAGQSAALSLFAAVLLATGVPAALRAADADHADKLPESWAIDFWREPQGLPHARVRAVTQTRDGYIWLGTGRGLARFDGVRFTLFDSRNSALKENEILALKEDRDGGLWAGTAGGGATLLKDGRFSTYSIANGLADDFVRQITEDSKGGIWIATNHGVSRITNGVIRSFSSKDGLADDVVRQIEEDPAGNVWVATDRGVSRFSDDRISTYATSAGRLSGLVNLISAGSREGVVAIAGGQLYRFSGDKFVVDKSIVEPSAGGIVSVTGSRDGSLWVTFDRGTVKRIRDGVCETFSLPDGLVVRGGLVFDDGKGNVWLPSRDGLLKLVDRQFRPVLPGSEAAQVGWVLNWCVDQEGSLWLGLEANGLARVRRTRFRTLTTDDGLPIDSTRSVFQDREGHIWIGTLAGIAEWTDGKIRRYANVDGDSLSAVTSIAEDSEGAIWFGATGQLLKLRDGKLTRDPAWKRVFDIKQIYRDPAGRMWVSTDGDGVFRFDGGNKTAFRVEDGLAGDQARAVLMDRKGTTWIATLTGVSRLADGKFTNYTAKDGLGSDRVNGIYEDDAGALWFITRGGLTRYFNGRFVNYTTRDGLFADFVGGMLDDGHGNYWFSCNQGIFEVSKAELADLVEGRIKTIRSRSFGVNDGMKTMAFSAGVQPAAWGTTDGRLLFCSLKGLVVIDPTASFANRIVPPVIIESVQINKQSQPVGQPADIVPGSGAMEIHYTALSYVAPDKVRFRYQLEGYDTEWVDAGTRRYAFYANLPAGSYRFRVIACNDNDVWNTVGASFTFRLQPHFYRTIGFDLLCGTVLVLGIGILYKLRVRQLEARERELKRKIAEAVANIRVLSGLLPICASCKKVRDDQGYWNQIETYLRQHSDTEVTHGLCPECVKRLYPEIADQVLIEGEDSGAAAKS